MGTPMRGPPPGSAMKLWEQVTPRTREQSRYDSDDSHADQPCQPCIGREATNPIRPPTPEEEEAPEIPAETPEWRQRFHAGGQVTPSGVYIPAGWLTSPPKQFSTPRHRRGPLGTPVRFWPRAD